MRAGAGSGSLYFYHQESLKNIAINNMETFKVFEERNTLIQSVPWVDSFD